MKTPKTPQGAIRRMPMRMLLLSAALPLAGAVGLSAQPASAPTQSTQSSMPAQLSGQQQQNIQQLQQIQSQLQSVEGRILKAQKAAMSDADVLEKRDSYETALREEIVKEDPALAPTIKQQREIAQQLMNSPEVKKPSGERSEAFNKQVQELTQLNKKIQPAARKAVQKPEVMDSYKTFQDELLSAMEQEDPQISQLLAQRNELRSHYQQIMGSIRQ